MSAIANFRGDVERQRESFAARLPKHVDPSRFIKILVTAAAKNPKILECDKESVILSALQAAELGLEPGGALGEGYLVPYGRTCQFIPGYRGFISLARRSGQIVSIEAHVVYSADHFECEFGLEPKLVHRPDLTAKDRGDILGFYAVARLKDGGTQFEFMPKADVEAIRKRSRAAQSGPWVTDYAEMGKKTVIRRIFKMLPVSVELVRALELQACAESGRFSDDLETIEAAEEQTDSLNAAAAAAAASRAEAQA